jgi:hypothetical protein
MATKVMNGLDLQSQRIQNVGSPSSGTDAANKDYVDSNITGLSWKNAVRAATTANGTLASAFENGDTIDGVTLATGDRILLKNQSTGGENGIYVVNATGAPTRATDADSTAELRNATTFVREGSTNADTAWVQTAEITTVGTTAQTWTQFGVGGSTYTADGQGIEVSANQFSLELIPSTSGLVKGASGVGIDTAVVARKYSQDIGNGSSTSITVTHSLGTKDVHVMLRQNSDDAVVLADVVCTSTTQVTVTFAVAPATNAIRVVVIG